MAWNTFSNSSPNNQPDGVKFQQNFDFICQAEGTLAEMMVIAAVSPTTKFLCVITDWGDGVAFYMGDVTKGTNGFVPLGG